MRTDQTACCIVGGGPAEMMLGLLLARRGFARLRFVTTLRARGAWYAFGTLDIAWERVRA